MAISSNTEMHILLKSPVEMMRELGLRARTIRLDMNLTQAGLAARAGISVGTIKRFESTGEVQLNYLLRIVLVLDRLKEFDALLQPQEAPRSLFAPEVTPTVRQRGRRK